MTDEQLIARVSGQDKEAFARLLTRHLDELHRYALRLSGSAADADDLAQETFVRVWLKARSYKPGTVKVTTWIHRIAHNLWIDEFRKRRRTANAAFEHMPDPAPGQDTLQADREDLARLQLALNGLPERQRSAIVLCQIQGFSNQEAATIINVSVRALESLLARARRSLKHQLSENDHD